MFCMGIMVFAKAQTYYWVGGSGKWSEWQKHWANSSGGIPGSAGGIPNQMITVVFDNKSFTLPNQCVTIDTVAICNSMFWTADTFSRFEFKHPYISVTIYGSLLLQRNMWMQPPNSFNFKSRHSRDTIRTNGVPIYQMTFTGTAEWILLDPLNVTQIQYDSGSLNFNGQYAQIGKFYGNSSSKLLDIRNSEIRGCTWQYAGNLRAEGSIIYTNRMSAGLKTKYHNVVLQPCDTDIDTDTAYITQGIYNKVNTTCHSSFNHIEADTFILSKTKNVCQIQDTIRINKAFYASGTPCEEIYFQSITETEPAIFDIKAACANLPNDTLLIDYVYIHGIKALTNNDNAKLKKGTHSPDINKDTTWGYGLGTDNYNQNWTMETYDSVFTTYFFNNKNKNICITNLPYTICSDNFLPSYDAKFEWRKNNLATPIIATTPTYNLTDSGTYYFTVNYGKGCRVTDSISVVFTYLKADIVHDTCRINNGKISLTAINATEPIIYEWTPNTNSKGEILAANSINYLAAGEYKLKFIDGNNCKMDSLFTVKSLPAFTISDITVLPDTCNRNVGEITLTVEYESWNNVAYQWIDLMDTSNSLKKLNSGSYLVKITDSLCGVDTTITINVPHINGPVANFVITDSCLPINAIFVLEDDTEGAPQAWIWNMGDGRTKQGQTIEHSYNFAGDYTISLKVTDKNGCTDTISKQIQVCDNELVVYIPSAFTPNGDGINDTWKPSILKNLIDGYKLSIFDRWGTLVFYTTDPDACWDGTMNGKDVQHNTLYSYRLIVRNFTGKEFEYIGYITAVR